MRAQACGSERCAPSLGWPPACEPPPPPRAGLLQAALDKARMKATAIADQDDAPTSYKNREIEKLYAKVRAAALGSWVLGAVAGQRAGGGSSS